MKNITRTARLVLAEMNLKETLKDVSFYSQRVAAEPSESNLASLADAKAMVKFYEDEITIWS